MLVDKFCDRGAPVGFELLYEDRICFTSFYDVKHICQNTSVFKAFILKSNVSTF